MRLACLLLLLSPAVASAQPATARVEFDHATGEARLIASRNGRADTTVLGRTPTVRLHRNVPVEVRVVNTNTALYRFSRESVATPLPETESLQSFMGRLQPYVPELRSALTRARERGAAGEAESPEARALAFAASVRMMTTAISSTEQSLFAVDEALFGPQGLQFYLTSALLALEQMRSGVAPEIASAPIRQALGHGPACHAGQPLRLAGAQHLLRSLSDVVRNAQDLRNSLADASYAFDPGWRAIRDSAQLIERRAQAALSDFEPLVSTAYRVERLVGIVANACSYWSAGTTTGTMTAGRELTIRVEPRTEVETARLADRPARSYTVAIQPWTLLRPAVSLGGIAAPGARFPTYATRSAAGGVEIYESGHKDARYALGGTLGFTWPGLDRRDERGFAVWLPELAVSAGGATGFGVGAAVSASFVKIGAGAMWIRHSALDGVRAGDVVADESHLRLTDSYRPAKLYVSLGVFDWAPFAGRLRMD